MKAVKSNVVKRSIKDTVFKKLFSEKKYQKQLLEDFFPNKCPIDESKIKDVHLSSTLTNDLTNDIALQYGKDFIFMAEEQSNWDEVLPFRFAMYANKTLAKYVEQNINLHQGFLDPNEIPKMRLVIIYLGAGHQETQIEVAKKYPCANANYVIEVYHEGPSKTGIMAQYIHFGKTQKEQLKRYPKDPKKALLETIGICEKNHWLVPFIQDNKEEIIDMTMLVNSMKMVNEGVTERMRREASEQGRAEGLKKGREEGLKQGRTEGLEQGREEGLEQGRTEGLEQGRTEGLEQGRTEGLEQGKAEGLELGLKQGKEKAAETLQSFIRSVYSYLIKSMDTEEAKKQTMIMLQVSQDQFDKAILNLQN